MAREDHPGALGPTGDGVLGETFHADWPAYPGDRSWAQALLRLGDFPLGTQFKCIDIIDQAALFVAEVGIRDADPMSDKHMHLAMRIEELLELDERGLVAGIDIDYSLTPAQINMKRSLGPELWEKLRTGDASLMIEVDGQRIPVPIPEDEDRDDFDDFDDFEILTARRRPEQVAIYPGTLVSLTSQASSELERVAKLTLQIPSSLQDRLLKLLGVSLFDSAIRDTGAALEMRMREYTSSGDFGQKLVDNYIETLLATGEYLPARLKSLRQELRSIYRFIRNEFAHNLHDIEPSRGYALLSRMCWHVVDVEELLASRP